MKTTCMVTAVALSLALTGGADAGADKPESMEGHGKMMGGPQGMEMPMARHRQAMMARMDSLDGILTTKLEAVHQAGTGEEKLQALEAVVAELVSQRRAMHEAMPGMMRKMMGHMMQHMGARMMSTPTERTD